MSKHNRNFVDYLAIPAPAVAAGGWTNATLQVYREFCVISRNGHRRGLVFHSRASLKKKLKIGEQTAFRALRRLEAAGAIVKTFQSNGGYNRRLGQGIANGYRVIRYDLASLVRRHLPFSKVNNCSTRGTSNTSPSERSEYRPPDVSPQRGQTADTGPPPLFEPQDTSETADWAAMNQILALGGAMPESIP